MSQDCPVPPGITSAFQAGRKRNVKGEDPREREWLLSKPCSASCPSLSWLDLSHMARPWLEAGRWPVGLHGVWVSQAVLTAGSCCIGWYIQNHTKCWLWAYMCLLVYINEALHLWYSPVCMIFCGLTEGFIMLKNYLSSLHGWLLRDGCQISSDVLLASVRFRHCYCHT